MISFSTIFDEICSPNKNSVLIKYGYTLPDFLEESGIELIPQSITTAPCLIQSPGTKFGFPIATTKRSALFVKAPKSFVLEWHVVTVQFFHFSNSDIGVPTILLRPRNIAEQVNIVIRTSSNEIKTSNHFK